MATSINNFLNKIGINFIKFYYDGVGCPKLGWAIRFIRLKSRGIGFWKNKEDSHCFYLAMWYVWRVERVCVK